MAVIDVITFLQTKGGPTGGRDGGTPLMTSISVQLCGTHMYSTMSAMPLLRT